MKESDWKKLDQEFERAVNSMKLKQQWLTQHFFDPRSGPDKKIEFDVDSRAVFAYASKIVEIANMYRAYADMGKLP